MSWPVHSRRKPAWRRNGETSTNALPTARRTRPVWADMPTSVLTALLPREDDPPEPPCWPTVPVTSPGRGPKARIRPGGASPGGRPPGTPLADGHRVQRLFRGSEEEALYPAGDAEGMNIQRPGRRP